MHEDEKLTDNSKIEYCRACKNCRFRDKRENGYRKAFCDVFKAPEFKYASILNNGDCEYYSEDKNG